MKSITKRLLAMVLTVAMLGSLIYVPASATVPELQLDAVTQATVTTQGEEVRFSFTPQTSDTYLLSSDCDYDTKGALYNAQGELLAEDDDGGRDNNFCVVYALEAGTTYYYGVRFYSEEMTGEIPVTLTTSPVERVEVDPITCIENVDGNMNYGSAGEFFQYDWWNRISYTVYYKDGSTYEGESIVFEYQGQRYDARYSDTQGTTPWELGGTGEGTLNFLGYEVTASVSVIESPVARVEFEPLVCIENFGGNMTSESEGAFYQYNWWSDITFTVYYKDGSSYHGSGTGFDYNGKSYHIEWADTQYENPWQVGNTYEVPMTFMGYTATASITVESTPVKSVAVAPITCYENFDGFHTSGPNGEYYRYEWYSKLNFTVTFEDGSVYQSEGSRYQYQGKDYWAQWTDSQSTDPWKAGNTYTETLNILGYEAPVQVTIDDTPVKRVEIDPITCIAGFGGELTTGPNGEYYRYNWMDSINYTVYFTDGSSWYNTNTYFNYQGMGYYAQASDTQETDPWVAGGTYNVTLNFLNYEVPVEVTLIDTPVTDVQLNPISIMEGSDGYTSEGPNGEYYHYNWWQNISFTITFDDGSTYTGGGSGFWYQNQYCSLQYSDTQDTAPWEPGNTYPVTLEFMGYSKDTQVTLKASPVVDVQVQPITCIENYGGSVSSGPDGEFYYYNWWHNLRYSITFEDGSVYEGSNTWFYYQNEGYNISWNDNQHNENWEVGNTYNVTVNFQGKEVTVPVTVEESPITSIQPDPVTLVNGLGGELRELWYEGAYTEYYHYYWWENLSYTVTFADGTQEKFTGMTFRYKGEDYTLDYTDSQNPAEPYLLGNTYEATVSAFGVEGTVLLTVTQAQEADGFRYVVQNDMAIIYGYTGTDTAVNVPQTIAGMPVKGIVSLNGADESVTQITIPDSVTMLSATAFPDTLQNLENLTIGSGISYFDGSGLWFAKKLQAVNFSENNENYMSVDGVVYDKDCTEMLLYPGGRTTTHIVPDSVENIDYIFNNMYALDHGISVIPGANATGFYYEDGVFYSADKKDILLVDCNKTGTFTMPETVEAVWEFSFMGTGLTEVVFSSNVTSVTYYSFAFSEALEKVVLPENLDSVDMMAFTDCTNLAQADLPEGMSRLGDYAFYNTGLKSITIPSSVYMFGYGVFEGSALESVTISEGVSELPSYTFKNTKLKTVTIPDSVYYMGTSVFANCAELTSATIGRNITNIPIKAFARTGLQTVTIPETVYSIGEYAFSESKLTNVVFGYDGIDIYEGAFAGCPLTEVNLGDRVRNVGDYAFTGIAAESVALPESLTTISYRCFAGSQNLANISVSQSLENLDGYAFENTQWWKDQPNGAVYLQNYFYGYKGKMPSGTTLELREGTVLVADYALENQYNLTTLKIPASLESFGTGWYGMTALAGCAGLENIVIDPANEVFTFENGILYENGEAIWGVVDEMQVNYYGPAQLEFGEQLDLDDIALYFSNINGSGCYARYTVQSNMISGFDPYNSGTQTVTVTAGRFGASFEVTVGEAVTEGIRIAVLPDTLEYARGQALRNSSMVVMAKIGNQEYPVTNYTLSGYDPQQTGEQTVTVTYSGFTATFQVTVKEDEQNFTSNETQVQVNVPETAFEEEVVLIVEQIQESDPVVEQLPEVIQNNNSVVFDISFAKAEDPTGEQTVQPEEEVTVSVPVPAGMNGLLCKVYHVLDGEPVDMNAVYQDGFMVFKTGHFSHYGMVELPGMKVSGNISGAKEGRVQIDILKNGKVIASTSTSDDEYLLEDIPEGELILRFSQAGKPAREITIQVGANEDLIKDLLFALMGDLDDDGEISDWDGILLARKLAGWQVELADMSVLDVDGSGEVDDWDGILLDRYLAGWIFDSLIGK